MMSNRAVGSPVKSLIRRLGSAKPGRDCRASFIVETALVAPFLIVLTLGTMEIGFTLDRYLTVNRLTRSAANMFFRGVDFSAGPNLALLLGSAPDLDASSGGDTVIYLARIDNSGWGPEVTSRTEIGNPSIHANSIGAPDGSGEVDPPVPVTLPNGVSLAAGERFYFAEIYHQPANLSLPRVHSWESGRWGNAL